MEGKKNTATARMIACAERGLSMLEYASAAAVLMVVIYVGMQAFGSGMNTFFSNLGTWASTIPTPAPLPTTAP